MPVVRSADYGYQLHPIDLATNKVLALAGRGEPRDVLDAIHLHQNVLELGPLVWAASGKDPGFSPGSLLELLGRRGKVRPEDLVRLHLSAPIDLRLLKEDWLAALDQAAHFVKSRPPEEAGCLYYSPALERFVDPNRTDAGPTIQHYGVPGGVLPRIVEQGGNSSQ
jgi:hypothetical protein